MKRHLALGCTAAAFAILAYGYAAKAEPVAPAAVSFKDGAIAASLTGGAGDPAKGKKWFAGRKLGNCLACHANSDLSNELFHGEVGPSLDGVGDRYDEAQLRGIVVNAKNTFDDTIMPAFYRTDGLSRPLEKFEGKTILSAEEVEDIVAYLKTLK